jgi:hypothetical protein
MPLIFVSIWVTIHLLGAYGLVRTTNGVVRSVCELGVEVFTHMLRCVHIDCDEHTTSKVCVQ